MAHSQILKHGIANTSQEIVHRIQISNTSSYSPGLMMSARSFRGFSILRGGNMVETAESTKRLPRNIKRKLEARS